MRTTAVHLQTKPSALQQVLLSILLGAVLSLVIVLALVIGFQVLYAGRIMPNIKVAGVDVSGLRPAAAAQRLSAALTYPTKGKIIFQYGQQQWVASPGDLGLFLDPETSATNAYNLGRKGSIFTVLGDQWDLITGSASLSPSLVLDQRMAYAYLSSLAKQIDRQVIEANLGINGVDVTVNAGQIGRHLDIPTVLNQLTAQLQTLQDGILPLAVKETPPAMVDPTAQAELARRILSAPLTLSLPDTAPDKDKVGPWTFEREALAAMLSIEKINNKYQVSLNTDTLRNYLAGLAPSLVMQPANARFTFNDSTNQLEVIQHAVIGRELDLEASIKTIQEKLSSGDHTIALQFKLNPPAVTDDMTGQKLGITQLVSEQTSYFYGSSPARVQNITTAAGRFHGLLIAPGEVFSMGSAMGDISLENGFAEALIISNGRTIQGVGGGVCQVSTTLFRTAFFGGFPINERYAHAYRVSYYEKQAGNRIDPHLAGLDATVYFPVVDFKFTNDTPYWLLMETYVNPSASSITWKFYSTSDGRSVEWDTTGPTNLKDAPPPVYKENPDLSKGDIKQVDYAAQGADVTVYRTVKRNGEVINQDTIKTHYQAWRAVYEYGPGTEGIPTPEGTPNG